MVAAGLFALLAFQKAPRSCEWLGGRKLEGPRAALQGLWHFRSLLPLRLTPSPPSCHSFALPVTGRREPWCEGFGSAASSKVRVRGAGSRAPG